MFNSFRLRIVLAGVLVVLLLAAVPLNAQEVRGDLFRTLESVINLVQVYHKDPIDRNTLLQGAVRGALAELKDPYTSYLTAEEYQEFTDGISGQVTGIGVHVDNVDQYIVVVSPIKGSPADKAGLLAGDRILEAEGVSLVGVPLEKAVKTIRGAPGSTVTLKIERPSEQRTFTLEIVRALIQIPIVEHELLPGNIAYIQIHSFSADSPQLFASAWRTMEEQGARGLLIDLRDNPGGYVTAVEAIASRFVPAGQPVIHTVGRGGTTETEVAGEGARIMVPTAVLVNKGSASASEILAGALQDYSAATLVGSQTFGKGTVQQLLTLSDGSVLKVTVAEYLTAQRRRVDKVGLTPDVKVEAFPSAPDRVRPMETKQVLTWGNTGLEILALQQRLNDLGYPAGPENGYFGGALRTAVERFQADRKLTVTGMADRATLEQLNEAVKTRQAEIKKQDIQREKALEVLKQQMIKANP